MQSQNNYKVSNFISTNTVVEIKEISFVNRGDGQPTPAINVQSFPGFKEKYFQTRQN